MLVPFLVCVLGTVASALFIHRKAEDGSWDFLEVMDAVPQWAHHGPVRRLKSARQEKVAILTSGTVQRYFLGHAAKGLIKPLVEQGHVADYFLTLNAAGFQSFRAGASTFVPELNGSLSSIEQLIRLRVSENGGTMRHLELSDGVSLSTDDEKTVKKSKIPGVRNLLKKDKKLEELWRRLEEEEKQHGRYTTVIVVDDDAIWFRPFDLDRLHSSSDRLAAEGYVLDCSHKTRGKGCCAVPGGYNDYIWILDREVAEPFGKQYSLLVHDSKFKREQSDEAFMGRLVKRYNITMNRRPADLIPMQRGGHEQDETTGKVDICLHKMCDGRLERGGQRYPYLRPMESMKICKSLEWLAHESRGFNHRCHWR